jgi:drug/metabolite transporter (DMT)-like permease
MHVGALARAPLSIVQAVISGGLVFLAVLAERFFDLRLGRWQWFGVTITAAGLAIIGLTASGAARPQRSSLAALIAVEAAVFAVGAALLAISTHRRIRHRVEGLLLGLAAGALFGVSDIAIKYLTHAEGVLYGLLSPWTATALLAGAIAFYASARSLQIGPGVEVIALTSVAANLVAIMGGIVVFDEPIGAGPLATAARFLAFCLVIAGAALMPAHHAERREPDTAPLVTASAS